MDINEVLNRVQYLREQRAFAEARDLLMSLPESELQETGILLLLGDAHGELGEWEQATANFHKAVRRSPNSEYASLGLFHCLWNQDRQIEALDEIRRFTANNQCTDYDEILGDILMSS